MKGIFRCTMGKGTQRKRTYGTSWVHQKEASANEIDGLTKTAAQVRTAGHFKEEVAGRY